MIEYKLEVLEYGESEYENPLYFTDRLNVLYHVTGLEWEPGDIRLSVRKRVTYGYSATPEFTQIDLPWQNLDDLETWAGYDGLRDKVLKLDPDSKNSLKSWIHDGDYHMRVSRAAGLYYATTSKFNTPATMYQHVDNYLDLETLLYDMDSLSKEWLWRTPVYKQGE